MRYSFYCNILQMSTYKHIHYQDSSKINFSSMHHFLQAEYLDAWAVDIDALLVEILCITLIVQRQVHPLVLI